MKAIRKAATVEGHSLTASVYRQLPSLFSKQIARRLANEERGLAEKNKEVVVKDPAKKTKKKRSRLSFLDFKSTDKIKVVPENDDNDSSKSKKSSSILGQIKKKLIKKISSTSSTSSSTPLQEIEDGSGMSPPGVRADQNCSSKSIYGEEEVAVLRRSIYGADKSKPLVSEDELDEDEVQDLLQSGGRDTSTNPYKRKISSSKISSSANPYALSSSRS